MNEREFIKRTIGRLEGRHIELIEIKAQLNEWRDYAKELELEKATFELDNSDLAKEIDSLKVKIKEVEKEDG